MSVVAENEARIREDVAAWNAWRKSRAERRGVQGEDLAGADLSRLDLSGIRLSHCNLNRADLRGAILDGARIDSAAFQEAKLHGARLRHAYGERAVFRGAECPDADFEGADLRFAILSRTDLSGAKFGPGDKDQPTDLRGASLRRADLRRADFTQAILRHVSLVEGKVEGARFLGAQIYGIAAWELEGEPATTTGMVIQADKDRPKLLVDDLDTAQFVFMLSRNATLKRMLDKTSSRTVLLLGRFTGRGAAAIDALREAVRKAGLLPIVFDFTPSKYEDELSTVLTLAGLSRYVIADVSDPHSVPAELALILPKITKPIAIFHREDQQIVNAIDTLIGRGGTLKPISYADEAELAAVSQKVVMADLDAEREAMSAARAERRSSSQRAADLLKEQDAAR